MISFELDDEQQMFVDTTRRLAADRLWPRLRQTEAARELPDDLRTEVHELGLTTLGVPEAAGGQGLGLLPECLVEEQLAWGDVSARYALGGPGAFGAFALELADEARVPALLSDFTAPDGAGRRGAVAFSEAAPSERGGLSTTATADGDAWILDGHKAFVIDGGRAHRYVVVAQVDAAAGVDGLGAFVVEAGAEGLGASERRRTLGLDAAHVADVSLTGVRVPSSARLLGGEDFAGALARAFARRALVVAAQCVGVASRAFELAHGYCQERTAFGKPIGHFQAVAFTIADRLMDVESARWLVWRAAAEWDRRAAPRLEDVAAACAHAKEVALRATDDGVQLFGGAGFIRDFAIEKLFRDARQLSLVGPTVETLDLLAADRELGRPLDLATVLPTPDLQPVLL